MKKHKYDSALEALQGMQDEALKGWEAIELNIVGDGVVIEYEKEG